MNDYASLENSKRLYEVSGWDDEDLLHWQKRRGDDGTTMYDLAIYESGFCPAYSAGYLLRKLPPTIQGNIPASERPLVLQANNPMWFARYEDIDATEHQVMADTPENSLVLLAIKLFEDGILVKGQE